MTYLQYVAHAWMKYQNLTARHHPILNKTINLGLFASLFHTTQSIDTHSAGQLKLALENHASASETTQKQILIQYFIKHPPESQDSFSSYLIDELRQMEPNGGWELFEVDPVITVSGNTVPLYRGVQYDPKIAFAEGMKQHYDSDSLDSYTSSQNGGVGNSTSLSYKVAFNYAAPQKNTDHEAQNAQRYCKQIFGVSYVYVIHSRSDKLIHIPNTHLARNNYIQYASCFFEDEINIVEDIPSSDLYCAIEVNRATRSINTVHYNPNYIRDENSDRIIELFDQRKQDVLIQNISDDNAELYNNVTPENALVKLQLLSQLFITVKYKSDLSSDACDAILTRIRNKAFDAFTKCIDSMDDAHQKNILIQYAIKLKIFSEHRHCSPMNAFFKTDTQLDLMSKITVKESKHKTIYPSRVIL